MEHGVWRPPGGRAPSVVTPALRCAAVGKRFGGISALEDVNLDIAPGEVHGLVGRNGAGKSTLLGVIAGRVVPTVGSVEAFGERLHAGDPRAGRDAGIAAIYQELTIVPAMSAQANVFLGQLRSSHGMLDGKSMRRRFL